MSKNDVVRLRATMQQMERLLLALQDLRESVLPKDPKLFAAMAEAPLEDLQRLRREIGGFVEEVKVGG
jgi:hypothetical protein